jgi:endoglycosylceramidase
MLFLWFSFLVVSIQGYSIDPYNQQIIDDCGRARIFHGVNAVEKEFPYLPDANGGEGEENALGEADMDLLQGLGMNMVRLGVLVAGTMPTDNSINSTYLSETKSMIEALNTRGIATLVDAHQDVLSPKLCGEGLPDWMVEKALALVGFNTSDASKAFPFPLPYDIEIDPDTGYPSVDSCMQNGFFFYYMTLESERLWHSLYSQPEIWADMSTHWGAVAAALAGTDGLMGYEMLNEPWSAMPGSDMTPQSPLSDNATLGALYNNLHAAIREQDSDGLFFFEPLVLESYENVLPTRVTDFPPGGPGADLHTGLGDGRSVFAYHSYCPSNPDGSPSHLPLCRELIHAAWKGVDRNLEHLGFTVGGFLTEFGAVGDNETDVELLEWQTAKADDALQSWSYWTYKSFDDVTTQNSHTETFFNEDGSYQVPKIKALSRTYAQAIAGKPSAMSFDSSNGLFELTFQVSSASSSSCGDIITEIFMHMTFYYPNGWQISVVKTSDGSEVSGYTTPIVNSGTTDLGDWQVIGLAIDDEYIGSEVTVTLQGL